MKNCCKGFLLGIVLFLQANLFGQSKHTLSGYITDSLSSESIIGATLSVNGKGRGVNSNQFGYYSITLPEGEYDILITHIGYNAQPLRVKLNADTSLNIHLSPKATIYVEVIVSSRKRDANVKSAQMGKFDLSMNQVKSLPVLLGEIDILKTIQLLPGVRNAGEGNTGLYVRGGGPDQNLIMLDDAIVYNTGHLFGFFSIFNSDAIKNTSLIKGGMPAQYGGRLSIGARRSHERRQHE